MTTPQPFTMEQTWLQCMNPQCEFRTDLLKERLFRCPRCGSLYDVQHNFDAILPPSFKNLAEYLRHTFLTRPFLCKQSGVWFFQELIMPHIPSEFIVSLGEGLVPIVEAGAHLKKWTGCENLWLILEGLTPTGSFKDLGGTVMISVAKAAGVQAIACASTGDTSAMAAAYAARASMKCAVILPRGKVTPTQLVQPLVHGAIVITLPGSFDDCMRVMQELVVHHGVYPANSLNPTRIEGHQATVFLLDQFFGWTLPDWIAVPVGNGSNVSSIGKGMRLLQNIGMVKRTARILGCQSAAANPLARAWFIADELKPPTIEQWKAAYQPIRVGETIATAARIGDPVSRDKVMREIVASNGAMEIASERDLNEAVLVAGRDGLFVCPQTGIAIAGLRDAVKAGWIRKEDRVVVVSTATGLKFTDAVTAQFSDAIVEAKDCETATVAKLIGV